MIILKSVRISPVFVMRNAMYCVVFISPNSTTSLPSVRHFMAKRICINLFLCKLLFTCKKRIAVATLSHSHYLLHRYNLACKLSERIDSDFLAGLCCNITIIFFCKLIIHVECVCMLLKCTNLNSVVSCPELNEHIIALGF